MGNNESVEKKNIFDYVDYREFLRDFYNRKKRETGYFSYRYFSNKAGFSSHNVLKLVINGDRNIATKSIEKYIKALGLSSREGAYFRQMVLFNQAKNESDRRTYYNELLKVKEGAEGTLISELQYRVYSEWYHLVIREIVHLMDLPIEVDYREIARVVNPKITPIEVAESFELLQKLELIEEGDDGFWKQCDKGIKTMPEVKSQAIRTHNRKMIQLAEEAIARFEPHNREISGMMLTLSPEMYTKIKKKIQNFKDDILAEVLSDSDRASKVCQLNFQLFPVVKEYE